MGPLICGGVEAVLAALLPCDSALRAFTVVAIVGEETTADFAPDHRSHGTDRHRYNIAVGVVHRSSRSFKACKAPSQTAGRDLFRFPAMTRSNRTDHIRLTSHPNPGANKRFPIHWGAGEPRDARPDHRDADQPRSPQRDRHALGKLRRVSRARDRREGARSATTFPI